MSREETGLPPDVSLHDGYLLPLTSVKMNLTLKKQIQPNVNVPVNKCRKKAQPSPYTGKLHTSVAAAEQGSHLVTFY